MLCLILSGLFVLGNPMLLASKTAQPTQDPEVERFLGEISMKFGLDSGAFSRVIKAVGNYGESYELNVGPNTPLKLDRGVNALWSNGGILYAAPIR